MFTSAVNEFKSQIDADAQVIDKALVIDNLLDLRGAASANPAVVARIDSLLGEVPGKNMTAIDWWRETLESLEQVSQFAELV